MTDIEIIDQIIDGLNKSGKVTERTSETSLFIGFQLPRGDRALPFDKLSTCIQVRHGIFTLDAFPSDLHFKKSAEANTLKLLNMINDVLLTGHFRLVNDPDLVVFNYSQFAREGISATYIDDIINMSAFSWIEFGEGIIPMMLGYSDDPEGAFAFCRTNIFKGLRE